MILWGWLILNRNKSQLDALHFLARSPPHRTLASSAPESQRLKSLRLQDADATKSQTLEFMKAVFLPLASIKRKSQLDVLRFGRSSPNRIGLFP